MLNIKYKKKVGAGGDSPASLITHAGTVFPYSLEMARGHSYFDRYKEPYLNYKTVAKGTDNPKILVPRALYPIAENDQRVAGDDVKFYWIGKPRNDEQVRVLKEVKAEVDAGNTGFFVNASTGFGKTFVGCYAIAQIKKPALILISKSDLKTQWERSFKDFLGLDKKEVGLIKGDTYNVLGYKVCIGFIQSVMKDGRYPSWVYKQFGLVIADEVHLMAADKFSNCMFLLPARHRIGLSATLDRSDGKAHVFKDHIGKKIIKAELLPMKFDVVKVTTGLTIPPYIKYKAGRTMQLNVYLGSIKTRQELITTKIKAALAKGRNIVCFADTLEHLDFAYETLINEGVPHSKIGFYVGGMTEEDLKVGAHKPVVLTTYKMCQYGTDYPHWDTAMLMTPRADVRQIVGRILRESKGKTNPVVFDFVDNAKLLYAYWGTRKKWYLKKADRIIN